MRKSGIPTATDTLAPLRIITEVSLINLVVLEKVNVRVGTFEKVFLEIITFVSLAMVLVNMEFICSIQ